MYKLWIGSMHSRLAFTDEKRYIPFMTSTEKALKTIQDLPDTVSWADIEERIRFLSAIDRGLEDIKAGRLYHPYTLFQLPSFDRAGGRDNPDQVTTSESPGFCNRPFFHESFPLEFWHSPEFCLRPFKL